MKIQYISDLHLELLKPHEILDLISKIQPIKDIDVLALCGDIGNPYHQSYEVFMEKINAEFKKTFVIAGNHEYYCNDVKITKLYMKNIFMKYPNITFLDNTIEEHEGYKFIGSTLWTHISNPKYKINDMNYIQNINIEKYNQLHQKCCDFIMDELSESKNNDKPTIILTHHVPLFELTAQKYRTPMLNPYHQWFSANMTNIIKSNNTIIKSWIYGHTHYKSSILMHNVDFHCNPVGYFGENEISEYNHFIEI